MLYESVEFHNVAEVVPVDGGGVRFQRVPEAVRKHLNPGAQERVLQPDNCEVRFVSKGPQVKVTLSSQEETEVFVFFGCSDTQQRFVVGRAPVTLTITATNPRLSKLDREHWQRLPFAPNVCRLMFGGPRRDRKSVV